MVQIMKPQLTPALTERELRAKAVKDRLYAQGYTVKQWAEANGYPTQEVYKILNGERKALYGRAHEIAVKIGLKQEISQTA